MDLAEIPATEGTTGDSGSITFIGTATTLIRFAGFTILTDPNFLHKGEKVRLGYGLTSTRQTDPALDIADLPPLDLVTLSHLHEDHFDRVAEEELERSLPIVTTRHATAYLRGKGFNEARALRAWQSIRFVKGDSVLRITSTPGKHAPRPLARLMPPVMGSLLDFQAPDGRSRLQLYISGDTLLHGRLGEIRTRYPDIDLGLLHLGGTRIFGVMLTMDAEQGVEAVRTVSPKLVIPIHYNDYPVFKSPLDDFKRAMESAGLEDRVTYLAHGETYAFEAP